MMLGTELQDELDTSNMSWQALCSQEETGSTSDLHLVSEYM